MKTKYFDSTSLKSFNPLTAYAGVLFGPPSLITNFKCFATILHEFFFLQYLKKIHVFHIPVVHVDHPLDKKIPFTPEKVKVYLDFINMWVRPLAMLVKKFGFWKASKITKLWMLRFRKLYQLCGKIYRYRLTTTDRPKYRKMKEFRKIYALDPHYLCVPSLHVATVFLAFGFYRYIFENEDFSQEEKSLWKAELYQCAVDITETVLYVKQHSVNCIPAALYLVVKNFPEWVKTEDARKFIDDLFKSPEGFSSTDSLQIKDYIRASFEKYLSEGEKASEWYEPIYNFLDNYSKKEAED